MPNFDFEHFIESIPPYKVIELSKEDIKKIASTSEIKVDLYCKKCNKIQTFTFNRSLYLNDINGANAYTRQMMTIEEIENKVQEAPQEDIYKELKFYCAKCDLKYVFIIRTDRSRMMKIGQYPSFGDLQCNEINKYKNLLPKYFIEFKSSLNCYSQGKGIAAFVYLRRILEHLVQEKYRCLTGKYDKDKTFIEKLKEVQKIEQIIPEEFDDIKGKIYEILSKGIHEYSEDECLEYYEHIKFLIIDILDKQLAEKERINKIKFVKSKLGNS